MYIFIFIIYIFIVRSSNISVPIFKKQQPAQQPAQPAPRLGIQTRRTAEGIPNDRCATRTTATNTSVNSPRKIIRKMDGKSWKMDGKHGKIIGKSWKIMENRGKWMEIPWENGWKIDRKWQEFLEKWFDTDKLFHHDPIGCQTWTHIQRNSIRCQWQLVTTSEN